MPANNYICATNQKGQAKSKSAYIPVYENSNVNPKFNPVMSLMLRVSDPEAANNPWETPFTFLPIGKSLVLITSGCQKKDDHCPSLSAIATAAKEAGDTIQLTTDISRNVVWYSLTGPNGITPTEQNTVIDRAQPINAGKYFVEAGMLDGCIQKATTNSITVTIPATACSPGINSTTVPVASSLTFYNIYAGAEKEDARAAFVPRSLNRPASSKNIYVTVNNHKVTTAFCNVAVSAQTYILNITASIAQA